MTGIILPRRRFLSLAVGLVAAPVVAKAASLMPVKAVAPELLKPVREVTIRAVRHHRGVYVTWADPMPPGGVLMNDGPDDFDRGIVPEMKVMISGPPIFDMKRHHVAGAAIDDGFFADEVIEFTTPDSPFYWGGMGRSGIVGDVVHVGHPLIEGGEYRVIEISRSDCGDDDFRAEGAPRKYWNAA